MDRTEQLLRTCTIERTRSGWIIVRLDGEVVWKRYTRDKAFTRCWLKWPSSGSPDQMSHTLSKFRGVELGGSWRPDTGRRYSAVHGGVLFDLPPVGETWEWERLPDPESTRANPFPNKGRWVRVGAPAVVF